MIKSLTSKKSSLILTGLVFLTSATLRCTDLSTEGLLAALLFSKAYAESAPETQSLKQNKDVDQLLTRLLEREQELKDRELELDEREATLHLVEQEVRRNLSELAEAEEALKSTMAIAATAAEDDLTQLTRIYESMKPASAAALFNSMDPKFAAGFLARMKANNAASVLAGLEPEIAYEISLILSGRNMEAPTE